MVGNHKIVTQRMWSGPQITMPASRIFVVGDKEYIICEGHSCHGKLGMWLWPSAVALAIEIARRDWPILNVLELGCGCGLSGLVPISKGCTTTFLDSESVCCMRVSENLVANKLVGRTVIAKWDDYNPEKPFDSLIGSDIIISAGHAESLATSIKRLWNRKGPCLFVDPGRDKAGRFKIALDGQGIEHRQSVIRGPLRDGSLADFDLYILPSGGQF